MSASKWSWPLASADNLLTDRECSMLLEEFDDDEDLLNTITCAAPKDESLSNFGIPDEFPTLYPPSPPEIKPNQAELADNILQQLENERKPENVLPDWLEEKTELSFFDNIQQIPGVEAGEVPVAGPLGPYAAQIVPQPTEELLREFETVYGVVKLTHLTPPHSPPGPATQLLLSYAQQAQCAPPPPAPTAAPAHPAHPAHADHWSAEYDDSQSLEELVRHRAAQLASPPPSPPSPHSSRSSSPRSSSTDEEWGAPSRPKPYSRAPDDRRSRKKEQNKNAATRYRQKKKAEIEVLLTEEQALCRRHAELGDKCADLQREIRYLKGFMRDLFKTKGLIK